MARVWNITLCQVLRLFEEIKNNIIVRIQSDIQDIYCEKGKAVSVKQSHVGGDLPRGSLRAGKNSIPINRNRKLLSPKEQFYVCGSIPLGERTVLSGTIFLLMVQCICIIDSSMFKFKWGIALKNVNAWMFWSLNILKGVFCLYVHIRGLYFL